MTRTDSSEKLAAQQEEILAILRGAQAMLVDPLTRDVAGLARARWSLMRALTAYQLLKQSEVFGPALARGMAADAGRVAQLRDAGTAAVDAFRGNVTKWSAVDVASTWPSYQASALAMITRLRDQVTRERRDLLALVGGIADGATPAPAAAPPRQDQPRPAG